MHEHSKTYARKPNILPDTKKRMLQYTINREAKLNLKKALCTQYTVLKNKTMSLKILLSLTKIGREKKHYT
jgi:hypothetical protein